MRGKLIAIGSLVATLTACASQSLGVAAPQTVDTATSDVEAVQMKTYTGLGGAFKFDYPKDWQVATDRIIGGAPGATKSLFEDRHGAKCRVDILPAAKDADYPDKESLLQKVTGPLQKGDDLKELYLKVDGNEIYERVFKFQQFKSPYFPVQAIFSFAILKDDEAYVLDVRCRFIDYERYLPIFERMGKSFRVYPVKRAKPQSISFCTRSLVKIPTNETRNSFC